MHLPVIAVGLVQEAAVFPLAKHGLLRGQCRRRIVATGFRLAQKPVPRADLVRENLNLDLKRSGRPVSSEVFRNFVLVPYNDETI